MLKLMLSLVLILASTLVGNSFAVTLSNRKNTLFLIHNAISRIKTLICFGSFDVLRVINETFCTEQFPLFSKEVFDNTSDYTKAFKESVYEIKRSYSLTKSDKELLISFGLQLGSTDVAGQVAHTELYSKLFEERLNFAKEQENKKSKLYRVLGFSFGCGLSLLIV